MKVNTRKETEALVIIKKAMEISQKPVALSSFGEDSLVLLSLMKRVMGCYPDVVFWEDGLPKHKYRHAYQSAENMNINLFIYPPTFADYWQTDGFFDVVHYFYVDGSRFLGLSSGCRPYRAGEDYLCAVGDLLSYPTIDTYDFQWDFIFSGQKSCDDLHITDRHEMQSAAVEFGDRFLIYPLHNWTDDDVWEYVERFALKVQKDRYEGNPGGREGTPENDKNNPNVAPTCYTCLDYNNEGREVWCPKQKINIPFAGKGRIAAEATNAAARELMKPIIGQEVN